MCSYMVDMLLTHFQHIIVIIITVIIIIIILVYNCDYDIGN